MQYHLSIIHRNRIEFILDGSKTIFYWFTRDRRPPYNTANKGDIIYIQATENTGGKVRGKFTVSEVETFDNLTPATVDNIFETYGQQMFGGHFSDSDFVNKDLERGRNSKYATLIHITKTCRFSNPKTRPFDKAYDRQTWMILDEYQVQAMRELDRGGIGDA